MKKFWDNLVGDNKNGNKKAASAPQIKNPLAGIGGRRNFSGQGQSLGGSIPGKVIPVVLSESGPLGIQVEKRPNSEGTAIIARVVEGTQAERAGLQRGDILCYGGSNGQSEIMYSYFIEMAKSDQRPMEFEVRRIQTRSQGSGGASSVAVPPGASNQSADAYARKQAMIAAAEAREKANKPRTVKRVTATTAAANNPLSQQQQQQDWDDEPKTEEARRARDAAKRSEAKTAAELGYNPYEANYVTAGQARTATVATTHGTIQAQQSDNNRGGTAQSQPTTIPSVQPPVNPASQSSTGSTTVAKTAPPPSDSFLNAYETAVTMNDHDKVVASFSILRKVLVNATTKGQQASEDSAKFRRVRLANAKIKAAIVELEGAIDIMLSAGFSLAEEDGESLLIFPMGDNGPSWLPSALERMEKYEKS